MIIGLSDNGILLYSNTEYAKTMSKSPAFWEPYCHRSEAEFHLSNFAARVLGRHAGVVFFDGIDAARLKQRFPMRTATRWISWRPSSGRRSCRSSLPRRSTR